MKPETQRILGYEKEYENRIVKAKKENVGIEVSRERLNDFFNDKSIMIIKLLKLFILINLAVFTVAIITKYSSQINLKIYLNAYGIEVVEMILLTLSIGIYAYLKINRNLNYKEFCWSLRINNNCIIINYNKRVYRIEFKNLISFRDYIKVYAESDADRNLSHYKRREIEIVYLDNKRIKTIELVYTFPTRIGSETFIWFIDESDIKKVSNYFITKSQIESNQELRNDVNYINVRSETEDEELKETMKNITKKNNNALNIQIIIFLIVIIIGIICQLVIPKLL